jgi:hypothetical protein
MVFRSTTCQSAIRHWLPMMSPGARFAGCGRAFLLIMGALYIPMIISYALVWVVNPYALRPWGVAVRLADFMYADDIVPRLFSVAAQDGTDLVVVGGSTSASITNIMLREAYPEANKPINLSFAGQSVDGLTTALAQLATSNSLKRVILTLDWNMITDRLGNGSASVNRFYSKSWHDPVPEFDFDAILLSARILLRGGLSLPDRRRRTPDRPDFMKSSSLSMTSPQVIANMARATDVSRAWITKGPAISCDAIRSLRTLVLPFAQLMATRGVPVDLFLPPCQYSRWPNLPRERQHLREPARASSMRCGARRDK